MSDPGIKLFGTTIALPLSSEEGGGLDDKGSPNNKDTEHESPNYSEEKTEHDKPSSDDDQKTGGEDDDNQNDSSTNKDKPPPTLLKKPDKILPCPRCNSMDTKFCYYNNYNVNQPRHFCKNCQRYWTAGGTMRNVPVGAGRRKNKNSVSTASYRHITVPDAAHNHSLKPNGTVLSFGSSDTPLCESMATVLNLAEKTMKKCNHQNSEEQIEERSTGSSAVASNCGDEGSAGADVANAQATFGHQFPYMNGSPWPCPWIAAAPPPAPNFPISFYPAIGGYWSIPWVTPLTGGPVSPTLGKHSRDGDVLSRVDRGDATSVKQSNLWIPKTLRIDDPEEAAKSSIWATFGFKNDKSDGNGGLFKPFPRKAELDSHKLEAPSQLLHANPAALSRSINFQENS